MANYTAADVKKLRDLTGSGMMDCKNALEAADGDIEKAVEALKEKSAKAVDKRAERTTANGLVAASGGTMIELNSETDFVAKNPEFQKLADDILQAAVAEKPATLEELLSAKVGEGTVADAVQALSGRIGEKLVLKQYATLEGPVAVYLHRRDPDLPPAIGAVVAYAGDDADAARSVAMHVAAAKPRFTTRDEVPADVLDAQRQEAEAAAREEGKPEQIVPRIVEGKIKKFLADSVLLDQISVLDEDKKSMESVLKDAGLTVRKFARFEVGHA